MVTALGEPGERLRGLEAGADDFLTKPVDYDTLMARVRSLVRLKRLLDEWRARGDTARALGLTTDRVLIPSIAGARALVVDDWDQSAQSIQDALAEDGVMPVYARGGAEAIGMTATVNFDLLVINLSLADEDPLKLVSVLRASDTTHETPLLLVGEPARRTASCAASNSARMTGWCSRSTRTNCGRGRATRSGGNSIRTGCGPIWAPRWKWR